MSSQSSVGTSFEIEDDNEKKSKSFFRRKRKGSSPFSLNLMRNKKSSDKQDIPCTANSLHPDSSFNTSFGDSLSPNHPYGGRISPGGISPPGAPPALPPRGGSYRSMSRSPPSPKSPLCKCRRCSILHLEECEPKEMNALFKFLRKSKVSFSANYFLDLIVEDSKH